MEINGSVILVTGAALRFGKALAIQLAKKHAAVIVHYHHSNAAATAFEKQLKRIHSEVSTFQADLTDPIQVHQLFHFCVTRYAKLDGIINSASIFQADELEHTDIAQWDTYHAVHHSAPFLLSKELYSFRKSHGLEDCPACVVNIIDSSITHPSVNRVAYSCAKSALLSQTKILASTLAPWVRVNAVSPGLFLPANEADEAYGKRLAAKLPLRKNVQQSDVIDAVIFLLGNESITGSVIEVDCGEHLI